MRTEQAKQLLQRVPTWSDPANKQADMEVIAPHLEQYGFEPGELDAVYDARLLAYIRANALREQRLTETLGKLGRVRKSKPAPSNRSNNKATNKRKGSRQHQPGNYAEKAMQVGQILSESK